MGWMRGAQGSGDWHPPILRAEWKSNGRLHLQTQMSYFQERRDSAELPYRPLSAPSSFVPHHPWHYRRHPTRPRLLAGVTTLPANKSFPARVTFGMFFLREVQMCSAKNANGRLLCFVGRHRRFSVFVERQNGKSCKTFCLCTGSGV